MSSKKIGSIGKNLSMLDNVGSDGLQFVTKSNKTHGNSVIERRNSSLRDCVDYSILEPCYFIAHLKKRKRMDGEICENEKDYIMEKEREKERERESESDRPGMISDIGEEDMGYKVFSVDNPRRMVWPRKQYIENGQHVISDKFNGSSAPHVTMLVRQFKIRGILWEEISLSIPEHVDCESFGIEPLNKYETREFRLGWNLTINEYNDFIDKLSTTSLTSSSRFFNYRNILQRGEEKYDNILYVNYRENGFPDRSYYSSMKYINIQKFKREYEEKERKKEFEELRQKNATLQRQIVSLQKDIRKILNSIS